MQRNYQVPSVHKALDVLELLSNIKQASLRDITEKLSLPTSTCYNILNTLESRGYISKGPESGLYSLGSQLMKIGLLAYREIDVRLVAQPYLWALHNSFNETAYLTVMAKPAYEGVVIEKLDSPHSIAVLRRVGDNVPLYASATGKSLLSGLNSSELKHYIEKIELIPFSNTTISDKNYLYEEVKKVREMGYALTNNELNDGAAAISVPLKNYKGEVIAAISLAGPVERMEQKTPAIIPFILQTAKDISMALGWA